jgi:2-aminoadipate transaminase
VTRAIKTYGGKRDIMVRALAREIPQATFRIPRGGYYLWVRMPATVDTDDLLGSARRYGVDFLPASQFYATGGAKNFLRLAYSYASPAEIMEGVRRWRKP